ncbi:vacuolar protein sorting-associated protein 52 A-like isoform X2 [Andrographis paniculata]|uniref:vacuolar protein sorting-associated protein 52 A-like isoform X2 n=1 Tax=Andrographis paniculata TaxID=175694 RepID=UPI0021E6E696|nr:vacuolar protein sorting-associated protein 52 A-like isoform X2 [Andrographis paniculata]
MVGDDVSLEGLEQELEDCKADELVANILSKGTKSRDYTKDVENNLRQSELESIEAEICSISSDIKILQEKSMGMGLKLKNRKVNEEYMRTLEILSKKIKFIESDAMVKTSKALNDVQPELEKLRQKAVSKEPLHGRFGGLLFKNSNVGLILLCGR